MNIIYMHTKTRNTKTVKDKKGGFELDPTLMKIELEKEVPTKK